MVSILSRIFIKDYKNYGSPEVRGAYGILCGALGIVLNLLLFAGKFFAGLISGSVAITADAFNNLSDAGSSLIMLIGFKLSGQKPNIRHPFGHGRIEYLAGLAVSVLIIVMGIELGKTSIDKIIHPEAPDFAIIPLLILGAAVLVKLYMFLYNRLTAQKISSAAMNATASDSISDCISTFVVLISALITKFSGLNIDGFCGVLVAAFILFTGIKSILETINPLLGNPPEEEFVKNIEKTVMSFDKVVGIHDLVVHDYGPCRVMISLHAEVSASEDILELHDEIDNIEKELRKKYGCEAVIHMDPIETDNETVVEFRKRVAEIAKQINEKITVHDLRIVPGPTHTNVIFDAVIPYDVEISAEEFTSTVNKKLKETDKSCFAVVNIDRSYVI